MALVTFKSKVDRKNDTITVTGLIPLTDDKCPKDKDGKIIPKSLITLADGTSIGVLTSRIYNKPLNFAKPIEAKVVYTEVKVQSKFDEKGNALAAGKTREVDASNISSLEFDSQLVAAINLAGNAGAVVNFAGMR